MRRPKQRGILTGLVLAFAALIFVELLLLGSATHQRNATAWVAHTRDVLQKMNELSRFLSEAESARRGYVLSGQDFYFERFTNRVARVQVALRQLRALTKDTPRRTAAC